MKRSRETLAERQARVERRALERSVRAQRKIRELSRRLVREIAGADYALREIGRIAIERSERASGGELEPALAGSSSSE